MHLWRQIGRYQTSEVVAQDASVASTVAAWIHMKIASVERPMRRNAALRSISGFIDRVFEIQLPEVGHAEHAESHSDVSDANLDITADDVR